MKASDFVAGYLASRGVACVFELVGGMITHLLDSMSTKTNIRIVSCHHEQAAGFAAEGYARIKGIPGVALATSGPGATNLLTAIGSCYFDSIPTVFITGQVNTHELKGNRGIRQLGFQECDIVSMASPICKLAVQIKSADEIPTALNEAFGQAMAGRQGPCLLDIPMNVQADAIPDERAEHELRQASELGLQLSSSGLSAEKWDRIHATLNSLIEAIDQASRPLLLIGGGCAGVNNRPSTLTIADLLGIPVVYSLMAVDLIPHSNSQRVGFIGSYGNRWANKTLAAADVLIVLGSRLDIRQTGSNLASFSEGKQIWQIDIDPAEMGVRVKPTHSVCCSVVDMAHALASCTKTPKEKHLHWPEQIRSLRQQYPAEREYPCLPGQINPIALLQMLSKQAPDPSHYVTDVGQHQMWAAQSLEIGCRDRFLTSGGMGAMGFGLPAAIGSAFAEPEVTTILISGDGSFQINIQELETLKRNQLAIKIILFNNNCHGMVRQFQDAYFGGNAQSTRDGYSSPNFTAVAAAYSIAARCVHTEDEVAAGLDWLFGISGPCLLEVMLSSDSKVYPKLAYGQRFGEMEPEASPLAFEASSAS